MLTTLRNELRKLRANLLRAGASARGATSRSGPRAGLRHAVLEQLRTELVGAGDDENLVSELLQRWDGEDREPGRREVLVYLLANHPKPHLANYLLALDEFKGAVEEVSSYPTHVWMDISSICSVECRFCKYTHDQLPKVVVPLAQIKSVEWLKYVRVLNLTAGTAEAITNPEFIEIFNYLRDTYPHLHLSFLTNGRTLSAKILNVLKDRLDAMHVSMNASNEAEYADIIRSGSWRSFSRNMRDMREIMKDAARPKISASFVLTRSNLSSVIEKLEFAAAHGASTVLFHHYYPKYVSDIHQGLASLQDKLRDEESLYFEHELSDRALAAVEPRARELGVEVQVPPPFKDEKGMHIYFGARSLTPPPKDCIYPWTNMYMLWGFKSKREEITLCCGLAQDIGVYFDRARMATLEGVREVWNSPTMRAYRRTANGSNVNPICDLCRKVDRFDPATVYPDQKSFFEFNNLPVPPHFQEQKTASHVIKLVR